MRVAPGAEVERLREKSSVKTPSSREKSGCCGSGKRQLTAPMSVISTVGLSGSLVERVSVSRKHPSAGGAKVRARFFDCPASMVRPSPATEKEPLAGMLGLTVRDWSPPRLVIGRVSWVDPGLLAKEPKSTSRAVLMSGLGLSGVDPRKRTSPRPTRSPPPTSSNQLSVSESLMASAAKVPPSGRVVDADWDRAGEFRSTELWKLAPPSAENSSVNDLASLPLGFPK